MNYEVLKSLIETDGFEDVEKRLYLFNVEVDTREDGSSLSKRRGNPPYKFRSDTSLDDFLSTTSGSP